MRPSKAVGAGAGAGTMRVERAFRAWSSCPSARGGETEAGEGRGALSGHPVSGNLEMDERVIKNSSLASVFPFCMQGD